MTNQSRRTFLQSAALLTALALGVPSAFAEAIKLRMSTPASDKDQRSVALAEVFAPAVEAFAAYEPHYGATLFKQGTELEAISRGNLEMCIASAQELSAFLPEFSIFTAGYLHKDAEHQKKVFAADFMQPLKQKVEETLGVKLLSVMYLGRRHVNLRTEQEVKTPPTSRA